MSNLTKQLFGVISQIKRNDNETTEIHLDCERLCIPCQKEISNGDSCTTNGVNLHVSLLSEVMKTNTVVDTVHIDAEILFMLDEMTCNDLFAAIGNLSNLSALDIHSTASKKVEIAWLTKALQKAMNLRSLRLCNIELVGSKEEFEQFNDALLVLSCSTLQKFISHQILLPTCYGLENLIVQALSKIPSQSSLEDIMIIPNGPSPSTGAIKSLCKISGLKRLSLNGFNFCQENLVGIAHALANPNSTLEYLNLSCNKLNDKDFLIIAYALELSSTNNTTKLTGLNLADNKLKHESGVALGKVLSINSTLKLLNVSGNKIGDEGGVAIAKSLFVNNSLEKLSLRHCSLGDDTLVSIAGSFHINKRLNKLNIKQNRRVKNMLSYQMLLEARKKSVTAREIVMDVRFPLEQTPEVKVNDYVLDMSKSKLNIRDSFYKRRSLVPLMSFIISAA